MSRIRQGDVAALEALYDRYAARMLGLALRILQQRELAEDAVQEAFFRVWKRADSFDPGRGDIFGWLAAIVRNVCLDHWRRQGTQPPLVDVAGDLDLPDPEADVAETAAEREERRQVRRALAALPAEQRQVLELSFFGGLTRRDIASRLNIPVGTIHTRARLGLQKLRDLLEI
jgi:RNA polymerase sigma-70 factor (ECF subfamily)